MSAEEEFRPRALDGSEDGAVFDAYARHELPVRVCGSCGRTQLPISHTCLYCASPALVDEVLEGPLTGTIHTFTVTNRGFLEFAAAAPYTVVLVDVDGHEGLRYVGNLIPSAPDGALRHLLGRRVRSTWVTYRDGVVLPQWELDGTAST